MSRVTFDLHTLPNCCGVWELGDINNEYGNNEYNFDLDEDGDIVAWLRNEAGGRPVIINFVQNRKATSYYKDHPEFEEVYEAQDLKDAIEGKEHVVDLGTWINPGSKNRIHAFMIKGTAHEEPSQA